jgi:hypothetical protein
MQVSQQPGWEERSLSYLCRSFDRLNRGDEYKNAGPAIHIGILDYTPYSDAPEFYSSYKLMNLKTPLNENLNSACKFKFRIED